MSDKMYAVVALDLWFNSVMKVRVFDSKVEASKFLMKDVRKFIAIKAAHGFRYRKRYAISEMNSEIKTLVGLEYRIGRVKRLFQWSIVEVMNNKEKEAENELTYDKEEMRKAYEQVKQEYANKEKKENELPLEVCEKDEEPEEAVKPEKKNKKEIEA